MTNQLLPFQSFNSKESLIADNKVKTNLIYITVIIAVITTIALLPIIKISLSIQGRGIIRPITEKTEIKAIQSEMVTALSVQEGQFVKQGDTLLQLRQDILIGKLTYLQSELDKQKTFISDLKGLTLKNIVPPTSGYYLSNFNSYRQRLKEIENKITKAKGEIERNKGLYENDVIPKKDYSDLQFNLSLLEEEKSTLKYEQQAQWKSDLDKYTTSVNDLNNQISETEKQKQFFVITAPVSGTIEEFSGIYIGSMLQAGQTIAVISPESEKIAEVYVSAKDIGYLKEGQLTKIQIDAFNYNQWGSLQGEIADISGDFILVDNTPVFKVKCKLDKDYLELKNGIKGKLKKGMTVNARFMIAKRSLFDLLYQKSDDWLNPTRNLAAHY
ncbi:MAG: HlyD family efflux transporter periplasmic adaptor subunit [Bacteroidota bacterium]|nr:MAG: HlyD family efflux transporter periplasmic adaptor subunit [Bacteroidota bacterium]